MTTNTTQERVSRLTVLLASERGAMAEFISELADFDLRRCWEELGYPSLFEFLVRELRLSRGNAFYRCKAVDLVRRLPEDLDALRDGKLCITTVPEVARVLTSENRAAVLPRFFHLSRDDAKLLSAELAPRQVVPAREVVTVLKTGDPATAGMPGPLLALEVARTIRATTTAAGVQRVNSSDPKALDRTGQGPALVLSVAVQTEAKEPLTGQLSRLHLTVTRKLLAKIEAAQLALSHARPGATIADILELGADAALAQDARRKGLVKKPRPHRPAATPANDSAHVPAEVRRAVWERDRGCCRWNLANGEVCGSRYRLQFDHVEPRALGGKSTVDNVRLLCQRHNLLVARQVFGEKLMDSYRRCAANARPKACRDGGSASSRSRSELRQPEGTG